MANEICTIFIGNGFLDDDYSFFDDGTIKRSYDQNTFKYSLESEPKPNEISEHKKIRILEKCPEQFKEQINVILYPTE